MRRLPSYAEWRRIVLEATVIAALGAVLGLSLHYRLVLDAGAKTAPPPAEATDYPAPATLEEVRSLLAAGGLAVDARGRELYREGHLPGAVSLPFEEVETELAPFRSRVPADRLLLVYCSGVGCLDSFDLAVRLKGAGYRQVRVFEGGFPAWRDAGRPVEEGDR